ncbi:MAG: tetratricopeptide repeat protein [Caldilineales bacterium]
MSGDLVRGKRAILIVLAAALAGMLLAGCNANTPEATPAGDANGLFQQGNAAFEVGNLAEAEQAFKQALEIDPTNAAYWTNLGVTYYSLGQLEDAEQAFLSGLEAEPDDAELHYLLGATYLQLDRMDDAQSNLEAATELDPDLPEPYFGLGALYQLQGDREEAIKAFERFLKVGPGQDPAAGPAAQATLEALQAGQ